MKIFSGKIPFKVKALRLWIISAPFLWIGLSNNSIAHFKAIFPDVSILFINDFLTENSINNNYEKGNPNMC